MTIYTSFGSNTKYFQFICDICFPHIHIYNLYSSSLFHQYHVKESHPYYKMCESQQTFDFFHGPILEDPILPCPYLLSHELGEKTSSDFTLSFVLSMKVYIVGVSQCTLCLRHCHSGQSWVYGRIHMSHYGCTPCPGFWPL